MGGFKVIQIAMLSLKGGVMKENIKFYKHTFYVIFITIRHNTLISYSDTYGHTCE